MSGQAGASVSETTGAFTALQWRAGQLSGQAQLQINSATAPSGLQWRAGQLSGQARTSERCPITQPSGFNGGPDNCPARPEADLRVRLRAIMLQWRAGQLSGQAPDVPGAMTISTVLQWRAGQLSGQARALAVALETAEQASMEGRTIVRPGHRRRYLRQ